MKKATIEQHLRDLLVEYDLCLDDGDWERLGYIQQCIDDTRDQLDNLKDPT
jgi:hypothetical protein